MLAAELYRFLSGITRYLEDGSLAEEAVRAASEAVGRAADEAIVNDIRCRDLNQHRESILKFGLLREYLGGDTAEHPAKFSQRDRRKFMNSHYSEPGVCGFS